MKLISDSGSNKTLWSCMSLDGGCTQFTGPGYNPNYVSGEEIRKDILKNLPQDFPATEIKEVFFYGAGITELNSPLVKNALHAVFGGAKEIHIFSDLLGAARALLGHSAGFAAILGTGSNSCLYDGEKITAKVPSLGFILGDEGSAGYIGKRLLTDYIRGAMPEHIHNLIEEITGHLSEAELIARIYTRPYPNRYCAQYCKFVGDHRHDDPYYHELMLGAFKAFFKNIVSLYPDYRKYGFNCVGSVAYAYRDLLEEAASDYGMSIGNILKSPMEGLIAYHSE